MEQTIVIIDESGNEIPVSQPKIIPFDVVEDDYYRRYLWDI